MRKKKKKNIKKGVNTTNCVAPENAADTLLCNKSFAHVNWPMTNEQA